MDELLVVGAGVSGLVAAVAAAERGWSVTVYEARSAAGGRARSMRGRFRANIGPHALYSDGAFWHWLEERGLLPPVVAPEQPKTLFRHHDRLGPWPAELGSPGDHAWREAPIDQSFRSWLEQRAGPEPAEAVIGLCFIATFDHDPGRLSAAFVNERLRRLLSGGARYVVGGWSTLVDDLTRRATQLGVRFRLGTRVRSVEQRPTIIATHLAEARRLTGDPSLAWASGRTALLDLGLRADEAADWFRVIDLQDRSPLYEHAVAEAVGEVRAGRQVLHVTYENGMREECVVRLAPGWCLMQSASVVVAFAARPTASGTLLAHLEQWRLPGRTSFTASKLEGELLEIEHLARSLD